MAVGLRVERPPEHSAAAATPSPSTTQSYAGLRHRPEDVSARGVLLVKIQIIPAAQLGHVREGRGGRRHSTLGDSHGSQAHTRESAQHSEPAQPLTAFPHGNLISRVLAAASALRVARQNAHVLALDVQHGKSSACEAGPAQGGEILQHAALMGCCGGEADHSRA